MKSMKDAFILNNGIQIPCVGFGTYKAPDGEIAVSSVLEAINCGYRHIDTASVYGNEVSVGKAIQQSEIARENLFVTSKLWNNIFGYQNTIDAFNQSLERLGLDYLDLYLIHWPVPAFFKDSWQERNALCWRALEDLYRLGKIRSIGVSNFKSHHIETLLETATIPPMVNQIEIHPGERQSAKVAFCKKHNILLEAYTPLGRGKVADVPIMKELEIKYNKSFAQICIRWCLQKGYVPLPKSVTKSRIEENTKVFDFVLSDGDMDLIDTITYENCKGKDTDNIDF